jgi:RNA polymerase sigma factor (sigma-70 family)
VRILDVPSFSAAAASISLAPVSVEGGVRVLSALDALALKAQGGCAAASRQLFSTLLRRLRPIVAREAARAGRPLAPVDIDDVVQELATSIWACDLHRFDATRGGFTTFLRKRVLWRLADLRRAQARHQHESLEERVEQLREPEAEGAAPDERLRSRAREQALSDLPQALESALEGLTDPAARAAFTRYDVDGAPLAVVAQELGVHPSNACRARKRALHFLARTLPRAMAEVA